MNPRLLSLLPLLLLACGPDLAVLDEAGGDDTTTAALRLPSEDHPDTVDVGSWNVEWFGAPEQGPTDEARQQRNVRAVLSQLDLDLVGLVEVVSPDAFHALLAGLPGYDGLLVTDPRVEGGATWYSPNEQKVALLFKSRFTVTAARVVDTDDAWAFGGRPPLEVQLSFTENGAARTLVVLVAHWKAMANADGYARRTKASASLKAYLDATWSTRWALVVGDFNDDLDQSTFHAQPSPFANFVVDAAHWRFTTDALTAAQQPTTTAFPNTIDHHLATHRLALRFEEGSAKVLHPDATIASYGSTTSDHFPVLTRYDLR